MAIKEYKFQLALLLALTIISAGLVGSILVWGWKYTPFYQSAPKNNSASSTPATIEELTARVDTLENIQDQNLKAFEWQLDQKLLILSSVALLIAFVAGFTGLKTYNDLTKVIDEEVRKALDKAIYHLDPTNLRIWIVSYDEDISLKGDAILEENGKQKRDKDNQPLFERIETNISVEMDKVEKRLKSTGLLNIKKIIKPDKVCFDGVTIIPIFNKSMEEDFQDFLGRNPNLDPSRAAFVLYTRDYFVSQSKTLEKYGNLATANMPPTVASMVLTVGRGLSNVSPSNKEETK